MNIHYYLCILIILCELSFFYSMYKLYVPLIMLLSREVLPDFSLLSVSISFLMLFKFWWEGYLVTFIVWEQWGVTGYHSL
jgi:hypothetical protein